MSVLVGDNTRLVIQGVTGTEGTFHGQQMIDYGTNIVAGVTPGKGGQEALGAPVYNSVQEAVKEVVDEVTKPDSPISSVFSQSFVCGVFVVLLFLFFLHKKGDNPYRYEFFNWNNI